MRRAGAGDSELARSRVIECEGHSDEPRIEASCVEPSVQHLQHFRGRAGMFNDVFAEDADGERAEKCGGRAFAGDVAKDQGEAAVAVRKKVVKVAAEFSRGNVGGSDVETWNFARTARKKLALDFACSVELREQALFVLASFLIEA